MRRHLLALTALASLAACDRETVTSLRPAPRAASLSLSASGAAQYLVEFKGNKLPSDLDARATALGASVVDTIGELGVAIIGGVTSSAAATLASQSDVATLLADVTVQPPSTQWRVTQTALEDTLAVVPMSVTHPELAAAFALQWNMRVIGADHAWAAGLLGSPDVRLAIIDAGIDPRLPDVGPLVDPTRSTSFCPADNPAIAQFFPGFPTWTDIEGHGTYVAAIAASRARLVAGVTSRTTLMAVKAFSQAGCPFSAVFQAMQYAADHGADVMNMSLGVVDLLPKNELQGFAHFFHLFAQYALHRGVSAIVVAAGNEGVDLQHSGNGFDVFCDVPGVICVSATGPTSAGPNSVGPFVNIDAPAFYSQFGASAIDVAAPGGNAGFDAAGHVTGVGLLYSSCASTTLVLDHGVFHPNACTGSFNFVLGALGTSGASPHVAGLAALLVSQLGRGNQAQVRAIIEQTADDLGKPGNDQFYGRGRINVAGAAGVP